MIFYYIKIIILYSICAFIFYVLLEYFALGGASLYYAYFYHPHRDEEDECYDENGEEIFKPGFIFYWQHAYVIPLYYEYRYKFYLTYLFFRQPLSFYYNLMLVKRVQFRKWWKNYKIYFNQQRNFDYWGNFKKLNIFLQAVYFPFRLFIVFPYVLLDDIIRVQIIGRLTDLAISRWGRSMRQWIKDLRALQGELDQQIGYIMDEKARPFNDTYGFDWIVKQNKSLPYDETINLLNRRQKNSFYAPSLSFWPIFIAFSLGLFLLLMIVFFHSSVLFAYLNLLTLVAILSIAVAVSFWFSVFFIEKRTGNHTNMVKENIKLGFYIFLFTEGLCFMALFWVFLHSFLAPSLHIGIYNPGEGIVNIYMNETVRIAKHWDIYQYSDIGTPTYYRLSSFYSSTDKNLLLDKHFNVHINFYDSGQLINPFKLPLLNTFILLTSAASINISHLALKTSRFGMSIKYLIITLGLGFFFVCVQYIEYKNCTYQYNDGIYAACFYSLTGLHGFHVIIGVSALFICLWNLYFKNYSANLHQSFLYAIYYWHFVDIIWIFVYFLMYFWPASYFFYDDIYLIYSNKIRVLNFSKNFFIRNLKYNLSYAYAYDAKVFYFNLLHFFFDFTTTQGYSHGIESYKEWSATQKTTHIRKILGVPYNMLDLIFYHEHTTKMLPADDVLFPSKITFPSDYIAYRYYTAASLKGFKKWVKAGTFTTEPVAVFLADEIANTKPVKNKTGRLSTHHKFLTYKKLSKWMVEDNIFDLILNAYVFIAVDKTNIFWSKFYDWAYTSEKERALVSLLQKKSIYNMKSGIFYGQEYYLLNFCKIAKHFNFNLVKKDPYVYCFVMRQMHPAYFATLETTFPMEYSYKTKRAFFYFMLLVINKRLAAFYASIFFPYINI